MINLTLDIFGAVFFLVVLILEMRYRKKRKRRLKGLCELDEAIASLRHLYYQSGAASWSVREVGSGLDDRLGTILISIADAIDDPLEEDMISFEAEDLSIGKYLKLLYLLLRSVEEYGDRSEGSENGLLAGLLDIRMDIKNELRLRRKKGHLYMGFVFTAVLPLLAMPAVSAWACDTLPELASFYDGKAGILIRLVIILITCVIYRSVIRLREGRDMVTPSPKLENLILTKTHMGKLVEQMIARNYTRALRMTEMLRSLGENYSVSVFYIRRFLFASAGILALVLLYSSSVMRTGSILPDILLFASCPILCFFAPFLALKIRSIVADDRTGEEIADLQLVASMMSESEGMNVPELLEVMEQFSVQLKPAISRCINNYSIDGDEALTQLHIEENDENFLRLVDCLARVDEVGVPGAFAEIGDDRRKFREYRNQETEFLLEDKANLAMLMAVLPGMLVLFVYLLLPFMTQALSLFDSYAGGLEESFI